MDKTETVCQTLPPHPTTENKVKHSSLAVEMER